MFNLEKIIWEYQQPNDGKRLAESWQKVNQKVGKLLAKNVDPTSPKGWANNASTLAEGWASVGPMLA